jgi:RHS repeat-associated protein
VTLLANDGGSAKESPAGGTLALVDGAINIPVSTQTLPPSSVTTEGVKIPSSTTLFAGNPKVAVSSKQKSPQPAIFLRDPIHAANGIGRSPFAASYLTTTNHDASFVYDAAGDVTSDGSDSSFTYDALRMTTGATVPLPSGGTRSFSYLYTADDERIALVEPLASGTTKAIWTLRGLDNRLLRTWADTTSSNGTHNWSWSEDEIWRGGSLLAYVSANGVRHTGLDHLGSPVVITDSLGHPIGNISYDPFGNGGATGAGMIAYTGHERDSSNVGTPWTGALPDYMHARYYSPTVGRFLSPDPLDGLQSFPQSWNRYAYARNNPLKYIDPTGKYVFEACSGNDEQCHADQAAFEQARQNDLGSRDAAVHNAAAAYGDPGQENGVTVAFGTPAQGSAGETRAFGQGHDNGTVTLSASVLIQTGLRGVALDASTQ